jgi:hypothetical protein
MRLTSSLSFFAARGCACGSTLVGFATAFVAAFGAAFVALTALALTGFAFWAGAFAVFLAFGAALAFLGAALAFFGAAFAPAVLRVRIQILQSNAERCV